MDKLRELAEKENVSIAFLPLLKQKDGLWGMYIPENKGKKPRIYLDIELKHNPKLYRLARCVLAEELGHHFTGVWSVFKIHTNYCLKKKRTADDEKALRWGTNKLIPTNELISLLEEGICECIDLADYFGVTAWFMFRKIEFLQYHVRAKRQDVRQALNWALVSRVKISCIY